MFTKATRSAAVGASRSTPAPAPPPAPARVTFDVPAVSAPSPDRARGVFDTLLVRDGHTVDLDSHLDRLVRDVRP